MQNSILKSAIRHSWYNYIHLTNKVLHQEEIWTSRSPQNLIWHSFINYRKRLQFFHQGIYYGSQWSRVTACHINIPGRFQVAILLKEYSRCWSFTPFEITCTTCHMISKAAMGIRKTKWLTQDGCHRPITAGAITWSFYGWFTGQVQIMTEFT